jgi:hypothetical protein
VTSRKACRDYEEMILGKGELFIMNFKLHNFLPLENWPDNFHV